MGKYIRWADGQVHQVPSLQQTHAIVPALHAACHVPHVPAHVIAACRWTCRKPYQVFSTRPLVPQAASECTQTHLAAATCITATLELPAAGPPGPAPAAAHGAPTGPPLHPLTSLLPSSQLADLGDGGCRGTCGDMCMRRCVALLGAALAAARQLSTSTPVGASRWGTSSRRVARSMCRSVARVCATVEQRVLTRSCRLEAQAIASAAAQTWGRGTRQGH